MEKQIKAAVIAGIVLGLMLAVPVMFAAWTTPRTWVASEVVTAAQMNAHMRDNLNILKTQINDDGTLFSRRLSYNTTNVGNVGSGVDDLMTYALPANTLDDTGDMVRITALFFLANNANSKNIRFATGSTGDVNIFPASTSFGNNWLVIEAWVVREGAASQQTFAQMTGGTQYAHAATATETLSGSVTLKFTGEAVSNNDIEQYSMLVELME